MRKILVLAVCLATCLVLSACGARPKPSSAHGLTVQVLPPPLTHPHQELLDVGGAGAYVWVAGNGQMALYRSGSTRPFSRYHLPVPEVTPAVNADGQVAAPADGNRVQVYTPGGRAVRWAAGASTVSAVLPARRGNWLVVSTHVDRLYTTRGHLLARFPGGPNALALGNTVVIWNPRTVTAMVYADNGDLLSVRSFPQLQRMNVGVAGSSAGIGGLVRVPTPPGWAVVSSGGSLLPLGSRGSAARVLGGWMVPAGSLGFGRQGQAWTLTTWRGQGIRIPYGNNLVTPLTSTPSGSLLVMSQTASAGVVVVDRQGHIWIRTRRPRYPSVAYLTSDGRWLYVIGRLHLVRIGPLNAVRVTG